MCNHQNENEYYEKEYLLGDNKQLIVRNPKIEDAESLVNYMKDVDCETKFLAREPGEFSLTVDQEKDFIKKASNNKNLLFLVCEIENEIVANCSVGIGNSNKRFKHRASMGLSVRKKYWNMSIGKVLMQESIEWCKRNNIEQLELEVVTKNDRALSVYKKFGFQIQGTKKRAMKYEDGTYADEYQMVLFFED